MGIMAKVIGWGQVYIASWHAYRTFSDALDAMPEHFPTLIDQLPDGEDGQTTPELAAQMLTELDQFDQLVTVSTQAVLVDTERQEDISKGSSVLQGVLSMDRVSGYDIGFDERGFFIRDRWELNRELFRAIRLEQRLLLPEVQQVEYVDLDTGQTFICRVPLGKAILGPDGLWRMYLQYFHIDLRDMPPERFSHITSPLRQALQAAIDLNQPVEWV